MIMIETAIGRIEGALLAKEHGSYEGALRVLKDVLKDLELHLKVYKKRRDDLATVLALLIDENKLREKHGEDTIGVLMKCGAFKVINVAELAEQIDKVDVQSLLSQSSRA